MGGHAEVRIALVQTRDAFVREQFGEDSHKRFRVGCSRPLLELLQTGDGEQWTDFAHLVEAVTLVDELFGKGDLAMAWDMGRFAVTHNRGAWSSLLMRYVSPSTIARLAGVIWDKHYRGGSLSSRVVGANEMVLEIVDWPTPHRALCLSVGGWIHGALEQGPRRDIAVDELSCRALGAERCEFKLSWR